MKINIQLFSKVSDKNLMNLQNYYLKLISRYTKIEVKIRKTRKDKKINYNDIKKYFGKGMNIVLTEHGKLYKTKTFSKYLKDLKLIETNLNFFIGNAFGFTKEVENKADLQLSLSPLTFSHELAHIVLLEQLFRCLNLAAGGKYHK
ncbi:hypothetical protein GF362_04410 [Candidatus Dojkabacteria bacterium]|nr:hypothetical protein [Candidatus Dojkabacteria bacterium]